MFDLTQCYFLLRKGNGLTHAFFLILIRTNRKIWIVLEQFIGMKNISEQKVTVLCDFSDSMNGVILHGIFIAAFLEKELCLLALSEKNNQDKTEIHDHLSEIAKTIKTKAKQMVVSTLVLKGSLEKNAERLTDKYDSVILILNREKIQVKIKALQESTIPYLFVEGKTTDLISYKKVILPIDFRKEMKETSLWASYFGRFNQALVQVIGAKETHHENQSRIKKNLVFIRKFLKELKVYYTIEEGLTNSWKIQSEVLTKSQKEGGDVLIILGSKNITPIDLLIGLPEKKIIKRAGNVPVLCVNPSKDLNILCD